MSRLLRAITGTVCAATIGLHAHIQTPQAPEAPAGTTGTDRIIVIGCISRESASSSGRGRGTATTARLILIDGRTDPPSAYRLEGDQTAIALHAGHTVEIAGTLSTGSSPGRGSTANARALKVETLTWISTSCQTPKAKGD